MKNAKCIGNRIYFRPIELKDIDLGWYDWINDNDAVEFLDGVYPISKEYLKSYYEQNQPPKSVMFAICDKNSDKYFGNAKLGPIDWINRSCNYGRLIGLKEYRGKGYGSEALKLLVEYGFFTLGLNRIHSGAIESNVASLKSNEKVGFRKEGIQIDAVWRNGKFNNVISLAITRNDYIKKYKK